jgi:hypothetical protein
MARSKRTPELVEEICDRIRETGRDVDGFTGLISKDTFYKWMSDPSDVSDFSDRIAAAKAHYREHSLPQLRRWARTGLKNTLKAVAAGQEIVSTSTHEVIDDGQIVTLTSVTRKPAMISPAQAFSHVMGREFDLALWVQQGVDENLLPRHIARALMAEVDGVQSRLAGIIAAGFVNGPDATEKPDPAGIHDVLWEALGLPVDPTPATTIATDPSPEANIAMYQEVRR